MIKKLSRRAAVVAGAAALAFAATAGTAYADAYYATGDLPSGCYGMLDLLNGNYGYGEVWAGDTTCTVYIYSENTSTGGTKLMQSFSVGAGGYGATNSYYYDGGVHKLMVIVDDGKWSSGTGYQN